MSDGDMVHRLRSWQKTIDTGLVYDAIDWLAQCQFLMGARVTAKSLRHYRLFQRACSHLWNQTKALVARQQRAAA